MSVYYEIWGILPDKKKRSLIMTYEEDKWQRAEKKAARLIEMEMSGVVLLEKKTNEKD
jgi:hypothetical protein